jgi:hypothetical protein
MFIWTLNTIILCANIELNILETNQYLQGLDGKFLL